jgi:hypothetical protein
MTLLVAGPPASAQKPFTLEQILSYSFSYDLVSARKADRIAWLEFNQGTRRLFGSRARFQARPPHQFHGR